jgi:hypothetical protein
MKHSIDTAQAEAIRAEIRSAWIERRPPRVAPDQLGEWLIIVERMLRTDDLGAVEHAARHLHAAFPRLAFLRNLCLLFDRLPSAEGLPAFKDDISKDVQVVRRRGAEVVILLFCGFGNRAGLPLAVMHRWFGKLPAHVVYLRDFHRHFYLSGIRSLGHDRRKTLHKLQRIVRKLRARRVVCFGTSGGVFGALHYGVLLEADRVLCLSGSTNLSPEFNRHAKRAEWTVPPENTDRRRSKRRRSMLVPRLAANADSAALELDARRYYEAAEHPPRTLLLYGSGNWDDRIQAENLRGLPCVTLQEFPDTGEHNIVPDVARRGEFEPLLTWLMQPEPQPPSSFEQIVRRRLAEFVAFFTPMPKAR